MIKTMWIIPVFAAGCGPLATPMVQRLSDERQMKVDQTWVNMLTPPDRLDRSVLLDAIIMNPLHTLGVNRLDMVSEKDMPDGTIVMEVHFDRADPSVDEFSIAFVDPSGIELWREVYPQSEVEEHVEFVKNMMATAGTCDGKQDFRQEQQSPPRIPDTEVQPQTWDEWCEMVKARLTTVREVTAPLADGTPLAEDTDPAAPPG